MSLEPIQPVGHELKTSLIATIVEGKVSIAQWALDGVYVEKKNKARGFTELREGRCLCLYNKVLCICPVEHRSSTLIGTPCVSLWAAQSPLYAISSPDNQHVGASKTPGAKFSSFIYIVFIIIILLYSPTGEETMTAMIRQLGPGGR